VVEHAPSVDVIFAEKLGGAQGRWASESGLTMDYEEET
jgi:hypothetical protein